ncbi:hypothetical protein OSB04_029965 [Centaurea solstitialis]|uniref:Uncharacterized protein n=1 Tax=Centaurea solstitialis TaxID=347529 RepID=A0AA38VSS4_9ASTR|nr:hypothetical protein OSB04_029965 [Centaurea solstitialis]
MIDYFDTYAPVARITSIKLPLALSSIYKLYVHQMMKSVHEESGRFCSSRIDVVYSRRLIDVIDSCCNEADVEVACRFLRKQIAVQSSLFDDGNFCFQAAIAATTTAFAADSSLSAPHTIDATVLLLSTSHT